MALLDSEILRIKAELGYNLLTVGASPYIGVTEIFEQVIQPYMSSGAITTSATSVSAASEPTPVAITLASATGFAAGAVVVVDVDSRQEAATVQSITGAVITLMLSKAHSGTYHVTVEGGESIVREILRKIALVKTAMSETHTASGTLKQVDEVQFYEAGKDSTFFGTLGQSLSFWREELAAALGVESMWASKRAGAQTLSVY